MANAASRGSPALRALLYAVLVFLALLFLLPVYVMVANSFKPLDEIRSGSLMALPQAWTVEPWLSAWSTAQIGVQPTGLKPFFINSVLMVVPAVAISTLLGALNGYVLTKWRFRGDNWVFGLLLFACFVPFQMLVNWKITVTTAIGPELGRMMRRKIWKKLAPSICAARISSFGKAS